MCVPKGEETINLAILNWMPNFYSDRNATITRNE